MKDALFVANLVGFAIGLAHMVRPPLGRKLYGYITSGAVAIIMSVANSKASDDDSLRIALACEVIAWIVIIIGVRVLEAFSSAYKMATAESTRSSDELNG